MKISKYLFLVVGMCVGLSTVSVQASTVTNAGVPIKVELNQKAVATKHGLLLLNGKTMIQIDDLAQIIQATVKREKDAVLITSNQLTIGFQLNGTKVQVGGKWIDAEQGARMLNTKLYVPLRWTLEKFSYDVTWNDVKRTVGVKKMENAEGQDGFTLVDEAALTATEKEFVDQVKMKKGVHKQGDLVVIARGDVPNPGYGLQIVEQKQSLEQLFVYVKLTNPEPGRMYAQVISYPYLVGKLALPPYTTVSFIDVDTKKGLFDIR